MERSEITNMSSVPAGSPVIGQELAQTTDIPDCSQRVQLLLDNTLAFFSTTFHRAVTDVLYGLKTVMQLIKTPEIQTPVTPNPVSIPAPASSETPAVAETSSGPVYDNFTLVPELSGLGAFKEKLSDVIDDAVFQINLKNNLFPHTEQTRLIVNGTPSNLDDLKNQLRHILPNQKYVDAVVVLSRNFYDLAIINKISAEEGKLGETGAYRELVDRVIDVNVDREKNKATLTVVGGTLVPFVDGTTPPAYKFVREYEFDLGSKKVTYTNFVYRGTLTQPSAS